MIRNKYDFAVINLTAQSLGDKGESPKKHEIKKINKIEKSVVHVKVSGYSEKNVKEISNLIQGLLCAEYVVWAGKVRENKPPNTGIHQFINVKFFPTSKLGESGREW